MDKVFVYGSLLEGLGNHSILEGSKALGPARTVEDFKMVSLGSFPGVLEGGEYPIIGEVYEVNRLTMGRLDALEGYPTFYDRRKVQLDTGEEAWMYILANQERYQDNLEVYGGDWRSFFHNPRTEANVGHY